MGDNEMTEMKLAKGLTLDEIIGDLSSIPLNQHDILFDRPDRSNDSERSSEGDDEWESGGGGGAQEARTLYAKLEKLVLLHSDGDSTQRYVEATEINNELGSLERRVESLQHFINLSKKFLSVKDSN